jgi:hypothetical protein
MKPRNEKDRREKRTRHNSLLFDGAKLGTTLPSLAELVEPKLPPFQGE